MSEKSQPILCGSTDRAWFSISYRLQWDSESANGDRQLQSDSTPRNGPVRVATSRMSVTNKADGKSEDKIELRCVASSFRSRPLTLTARRSKSG